MDQWYHDGSTLRIGLACNHVHPAWCGWPMLLSIAFFPGKSRRRAIRREVCDWVWLNDPFQEFLWLDLSSGCVGKPNHVVNWSELQEVDWIGMELDKHFRIVTEIEWEYGVMLGDYPNTRKIEMEGRFSFSVIHISTCLLINVLWTISYTGHALSLLLFSVL